MQPEDGESESFLCPKCKLRLWQGAPIHPKGDTGVEL